MEGKARVYGFLNGISGLSTVGTESNHGHISNVSSGLGKHVYKANILHKIVDDFNNLKNRCLVLKYSNNLY